MSIVNAQFFLIKTCISVPHRLDANLYIIPLEFNLIKCDNAISVCFDRNQCHISKHQTHNVNQVIDRWSSRWYHQLHSGVNSGNVVHTALNRKALPRPTPLLPTDANTEAERPNEKCIHEYINIYWKVSLSVCLSVCILNISSTGHFEAEIWQLYCSRPKEVRCPVCILLDKLFSRSRFERFAGHQVIGPFRTHPFRIGTAHI